MGGVQWNITHPDARDCDNCKVYYFKPKTNVILGLREPGDLPNCGDCPYKNRVELTPENAFIYDLFNRCHTRTRYDGGVIIEHKILPRAGGLLDQDPAHILAFSLITHLFRQHYG